MAIALPILINTGSPMKTALAMAASVLIALSCGGPQKGEQAMAQVEYAGKVNAPDFPKGLDWLNTDHPISLRDLRGKVVLLDFWTFCCINCIHEIPELRKLEEAFPDDLVVIGVHSAKFTTEQGTENIREAIFRYGIRHPVINDKDLEVWNAYAVNAWPTFILIDPEGKVYGHHSGEGVYEVMHPVIDAMIREFDARGKINHTPIRLVPEQSRASQAFLSFPGKIVADPQHHCLIIADSDHNRIVVVSMPDATIQAIVGSGTAGFADGPFAEAQFRKPQGVAVEGDSIYVADTENHAIRVIDRARRMVFTLAGTGTQARDYNVPGNGRSVALNSPWDLVYDAGRLFIAMAGSHQIWTLDVRTLDAAPYAGSARENLTDGPLHEAALAQPSGITRDGDVLYIADSEDSGVRTMSTDGTGSVRTIVGQGLFEFGDKDGKGKAVRLQHPIGICASGGAVYVADTYNNKIKKIDPATRSCMTLVGTGKSGMDDGPADHATLNEPCGLCFLDGKMYFTDTNNHLIRSWDPSTNQVSTLQLKGMGEFIAGPRSRKSAFVGDQVQLGPQKITPGSGAIQVTVAIPPGYKLNDAAPFYIGCSASDSSVVRIPDGSAEQNLAHPSFPISIPTSFAPGTTNVEIDLVVYYCDAKAESLCLIKQLRISVPVSVTSAGSGHTLRCDAVVQ